MTLRLYVTADLVPGPLALCKEHAHYVATVMRAKAGDAVLVFNGRQGEWRGRVDTAARNSVVLALEEQTRLQSPEPDLWLVAAPIKKERIDLVAEKAAELGASALWPVFTRRTVMSRVNTERLSAHMIEAAEQCERLSVPELKEPAPLDKVLAGWRPGRVLLYLDESGGGQPLAAVLAEMAAGMPLALLVGPEGGFAPEERQMLAKLPFARAVGLGPRILRAETAAIAGLAVVQALCGDWARPPRG